MTAVRTAGTALSAELVRTRRSAAARLTLFGLVVCLLSVAGQLLVSTTRSWTSLMQWHVPYVTVTAGGLTALLVALTERRERRARGGGTGWRAVSPAAQRAARTVVLAALALAASLLVFLPSIPAGLALGLTDPPLGRLATAAVLCWATGLGWLVVAVALARVLGPWPVVGAGLVWQVTGTLLAESDHWWLLPPTWSVRPLLPLIRAHANGVGLEPGSPVWAYPAGPAVTASLLLAVVALPAAVLGGRAGTARPLRGLAGSLRRTAIPPLTVCALGGLAAVAVVYPPSYPSGLFGLLVLPGGAAVLAVLAWQAQEPAWRVLLTRSAGPARLPSALLALLGAVVVGACLVAAGLLVVSGADPASAAAPVLIGVPVGWAGVAVTLWCHARLHVAVAWLVAFTAMTGGLLFGGTTLSATPLWLAGPAAWTVSADTPGRAAVAVTASLAVAALAGTGFVRTVARG